MARKPIGLEDRKEAGFILLLCAKQEYLGSESTRKGGGDTLQSHVVSQLGFRHDLPPVKQPQVSKIIGQMHDAKYLIKDRRKRQYNVLRPTLNTSTFTVKVIDKINREFRSTKEMMLSQYENRLHAYRAKENKETHCEDTIRTIEQNIEFVKGIESIDVNVSTNILKPLVAPFLYNRYFDLRPTDTHPTINELMNEFKEAVLSAAIDPPYLINEELRGVIEQLRGLETLKHIARLRMLSIQAQDIRLELQILDGTVYYHTPKSNKSNTTESGRAHRSPKTYKQRRTTSIQSHSENGPFVRRRKTPKSSKKRQSGGTKTRPKKLRR